ncbi:endophilin-B1-like isoform X2 [Paramacrobiotus metropolitanus]|uniref:endophilin-B1-like isoform X2 n=1 Tax=Paramacrobiotus metropolitanus TaxID=2943436 RepID=UPI00244565BD|nr:endophilin-B1-like isoform X2 [Paramacrobiotus metropolitanus]XP_055329261.1 endophilin-B1-like isoform X2 [Paramacrobiotus metropolitanus]
MAFAWRRGLRRTEEKLTHVLTTPIAEDVQQKIINLNNTAERTAHIVKYVEKVIKPFREQSKEFYIYDSTPGCTTAEKYNPHMQLGRALGAAVPGVIEENQEFGNILSVLGKCEEDLGYEELKHVNRTAEIILRPMRDFLRQNLLQASKEKHSLINRRLDLDAAKGRLKKAKTQDQIAAAETAVRVAQVEFDRQTEIVRIVLDDVEQSQGSQLSALVQFLEAQLDYHRDALSVLEKHKALMSNKHNMSKSNEYARSQTSTKPYKPTPKSPKVETIDADFVMAKVNQDYLPKRTQEVAVRTGETVKAFDINPGNENPDHWMYVKRVDGMQGYVPMHILEAIQ